MLKPSPDSGNGYVSANRTVLDALLDLQLRESTAARPQLTRPRAAMELDSIDVRDEHCACGVPLHYRDPSVQAFVEGVIAERGPNVIAPIGGRSFEVPRHYIALHGLADDIDPVALGFACVDELTADARPTGSA